MKFRVGESRDPADWGLCYECTEWFLWEYMMHGRDKLWRCEACVNRLVNIEKGYPPFDIDIIGGLNGY